MQSPSPGLAIHGEPHLDESSSMDPLHSNRQGFSHKEREVLDVLFSTEQPIGSLPATVHCCRVLAMPSLPDIGTRLPPALRLCPEQSGVVCLSTCTSTIGDSGSCETGNLV